jgi:uncharacterized RDD family membrane protein YckC
VQPYSPPRDPTGVIGRRIGAGLIDTVLYVVAFGVVWQSQAQYIRRSDGLQFGDLCDVVNLQTNASQCIEIGDRAYFTTGATAVWLSVGGLAVAALLFGIVQGLTGWTPGKLIVGIRTVAEDGSVPGVGRGLLRGLLWIVDGPCGLFVPFGLVGFITALTTKGHRRVGDMAAKTFVVRKDDAGRPIEVPGLTQPAAAGGYGQPQWGGPPQQGGWGPPPQAAGWGAGPPGGATASSSPGAGAGTATSAPPSSGGDSGGGGPQWDEARGTYIQWDENSRKWLQWDEGSQTWSPIPGQ